MRRNELIPFPRRVENAEPNTEDDGVEWDLPPVGTVAQSGPIGNELGSDVGTQRRQKRGYTASAADKDAEQARARGNDDAFAVVRETDAAEHRQGPWGSGDARTWAWIAVMFFGFLLFTAFIYFLPYGRHAAPPPIRVY